MCGGVTRGYSSPVGTSSKQHWRRRSADVGGLHLATGNDGNGQGWAGGSGELKTQFAELLTDMYTSTLQAVNEQGSDLDPPEVSPETRLRLIELLDRWKFEPYKLSEQEQLSSTLILFEGLYRTKGMEETTGVSMVQITPFVRHLRRIYRLENSYHNFVHALDVLQATYCYLRSAGMIPPLSTLLKPGAMWTPARPYDSGPLITSLGLNDLFLVYIAAIGHDAGHPGFSNAFMKNAVAPLSEVYDGKSPLEHMHVQLLLRVMRTHGLGIVVDNPRTGCRARKLLLQTVLATDMSVHELFMKNFQLLADGAAGPICLRQIFTCQVIMKCADISNPSRPFEVAKHWAGALMEEWSSQALYEKYLHLPTTVESTDSPINEAKTQIYFATHFAKPLLDLAVQAVPEMTPFAGQCGSNLRVWTKRLKCLDTHQDSQSNSPSTTPRHPDDYMTAFPLTIPPAHRAPQGEHVPGSPAATGSRSSDSSSSTSESNLCSPSPSGSVSSFFSPSSEFSSPHPRPPSSTGGTSVVGNLPSSPQLNGHAAIRAAGKLGIRRQKSLNRNSWSPSAFTNQAPPPVPPKPAMTLMMATATTADPTRSPTILPPDLGIKNTIVINNPIKTKLQKA